MSRGITPKTTLELMYLPEAKSRTKITNPSYILTTWAPTTWVPTQFWKVFFPRIQIISIFFFKKLSHLSFSGDLSTFFKKKIATFRPGRTRKLTTSVDQPFPYS